MNSTRFSLLFVATATLLLTGCAPEPNDVCAHMDKVYKISEDKPAFLKSREACVESFESKKSRRGVNSYRREAECLLNSSRPYEATQCMEAEAKR